MTKQRRSNVVFLAWFSVFILTCHITGLVAQTVAIEIAFGAVANSLVEPICQPLNTQEFKADTLTQPSCGRYFKCSGSFFVHYECPSGFKYDRAAGSAENQKCSADSSCNAEYCLNQYYLTGRADRAHLYRHNGLACEEYVTCYLGYGKVRSCPKGWQMDVNTEMCSLVCDGTGFVYFITGGLILTGIMLVVMAALIVKVRRQLDDMDEQRENLVAKEIF